MKTLTLSRKFTFGALALAVIAAGSAAVLTGGCHRADSSTTADGREGDTAAQTATTHGIAVNGARGRAEAPGLLHVYALKFDQDLGFIAKETQPGRRSPESAKVKLGVQGELRLAYVGADGARHRLYAELANVKVELGNSSDTAVVAAELAKPFYVSADPDGRVRGYAFARGLSSTAQNILRSMIGQAQIAARPDAAFTADEDDIHGSYVATYAREANKITKTKGRYDRIAGANSVEPADKSARVETGGRTVAKLDESGWLVSLLSEEKKLASLGDNMPTASTDLRLDMQLTSTRLEPSLAGRFERDQGALMTVGPFGTADQEAAQRASDERLAGNRSLDELLAVAKTTQGDQPRGIVAEQMAARFRLTPGETENAVARASQLAKADAQLLTSALGGTGTAEATRALGAIANQKNVDVEVRAQAATQLAFAGKNAGEARDSLLAALGDGSRDVRTSAALALGNVARELGGEATVVNELVHSYREAQTDDERVAFLHALGNSGSPEVLPLVREALATPNEALRDAAVQALRFLPLGEADVLLDAALLGDESENVRQAAVDAIGFRIVERHAPTLARVIPNESSRRVKNEIAAVIGRALVKRGATLSNEGRATLQALLALLPPPAAE